MSLGGQTVAVHLVMWTNEHGYIPGKKEIDHFCRNRLCVRPEQDHLQLVTRKRNILRQWDLTPQTSSIAIAPTDLLVLPANENEDIASIDLGTRHQCSNRHRRCYAPDCDRHAQRHARLLLSGCHGLLGVSLSSNSDGVDGLRKDHGDDVRFAVPRVSGCAFGDRQKVSCAPPREPSESA